MPSNMPATTIRIDPEVKREATAILDELGLSMSTAVNAFLRALVREGGMPFEMRVKTIVQSQEDDGAECQSWSNRAICKGVKLSL